jgi:hypothetical protein
MTLLIEGHQKGEVEEIKPQAIEDSLQELLRGGMSASSAAKEVNSALLVNVPSMFS